MNLEFETIKGYRPLPWQSVCQEVTMESIVPDLCPDIQEIVDVMGQPILEESSCGERTVRLSGRIETTVLYYTEESKALGAMSVSVPFHCAAELPGVNDRCKVTATLRLKYADATTINPRKILLRGEVAADVQVLLPLEEQRCVGGGQNGEGQDLCQKRVTCEEYLLTELIAKPILMDEDFVQRDGGEPHKLLAATLSGIRAESKAVGSKLVLKGEAIIRLLFEDETGRVLGLRQTYPFSQVSELGDAAEECSSELRMGVSGFHYRQDEFQPALIHLNLTLLAQACIYTKHRSAYVTDMYSTGSLTDVTREQCSLCRTRTVSENEVPMRELLETDIQVRSILDSYAAVGKIIQEETGGLSAEIIITLYVLDQEDCLHCIRKKTDASYDLPGKEDHQICGWAVCGEDIHASPVMGGVEVRFNVTFHSVHSSWEELPLVKDVRLLKPRATEGGKRPSIILRSARRDEDLWEIAKVCGATEEAIMEANQMEDPHILANRMLLIPMGRS